MDIFGAICSPSQLEIIQVGITQKGLEEEVTNLF